MSIRTGGSTGSGVEPGLHPSAAVVTQRGQVAIEYLLLTVFVVMVLVSDEGQGSLRQLLDAIQSYYARFTYGISLP
ncbi:MAG: hypothetical protein Q4B17_05635 [Lautropia sp.]|nr:hypothetical protein [Lautropia sp.]